MGVLEGHCLIEMVFGLKHLANLDEGWFHLHYSLKHAQMFKTCALSIRFTSVAATKIQIVALNDTYGNKDDEESKRAHSTLAEIHWLNTDECE